MSWKPEADEIEARREAARAMGGPEAVRRQHERGRLTIRERLDLLVDPGSLEEQGPLAGEVERDGAKLSIDLRVGEVTSESGETIGRIGASVRVPPDLYAGMRSTQRYAPVAALRAAAEKTWDMAALTVRMIARMLTGDVSVKNISGPINIAQYAGYSASSGLNSFIGFLAIVSISLGILNLLPVPMLDGGQIVYQLAEGIKGSPMSERAQLIGQQMGILLLIVLMSFAFYNDISRLLG